MVGMIIAGTDPLEAVRLQVVVLYMLLGSVSIATIVVGLLSYRSFFTPRHQLREFSSLSGPARGDTVG
jgi:putative ABC transport system permease protein